MAREATKPRIYQCTRKPCKKVFTTKGDMNRHVRYVHDGVLDGECPICGKRFGQRTVLKGHINTHTNQKPYKCPIAGCGKSFGDQSSCTRHKKEKHSGERYTCVFGRCTKTTKRKSEMSKHLQKKHGIKDSLDEMVERTKQHVKQEIPESPLSDLTSLPDEEGDLSSFRDLIRMTPSPPCVPHLSPPLSVSCGFLQEDVKPALSLLEPLPESNYNPLYDPFLGYPPMADSSCGGMQSMLSAPFDLSYGGTSCYPSDYTYTSYDNHLSPAAASSSADSPLPLLSPSPGPLLCDTPALAYTPTPSPELSYGYESLSPRADWPQLSSPISSLPPPPPCPWRL